MGLAQVQLLVQLAEISCGECGGTYAINERYRQQKYQEGKSWNCPYCKCGWGYSGNSENEQLRRELEAEKKRKLEALVRANDATAERDKLARKLTRVGRGVCPECNRSFINLARHMNCKHRKQAV